MVEKVIEMATHPIRVNPATDFSAVAFFCASGRPGSFVEVLVGIDASMAKVLMNFYGFRPIIAPLRPHPLWRDDNV